MNKPGIFKLADLLALQVIALVYQCSPQFITYSSTSRLLVLMCSVRCLCVGECVRMFMCVSLQIKKSKHNDARSEIMVLLTVVHFIYAGLVLMMAKVLYVQIWTKY